MTGEHGGLFIPQGTLGWDASAPPASAGSRCVGEAGDQMTRALGEHGGLVIPQGTLASGPMLSISQNVRLCVCVFV